MAGKLVEHALVPGKEERSWCVRGTVHNVSLPAIWGGKLNMSGRGTVYTAPRPRVTLRKATLELSDRDLEHAAHRLGGTPQQLVAHRESTNVLRTHRQLADAPHRNIQRAGSSNRS